MSATCRGCGEELLWALTPAGKKAPVEVKRSEEGNVLVLKPAGLDTYLAVTLSAEMLTRAQERGVPLHLNHFAHCPSREDFKK